LIGRRNIDDNFISNSYLGKCDIDTNNGGIKALLDWQFPITAYDRNVSIVKVGKNPLQNNGNYLERKKLSCPIADISELTQSTLRKYLYPLKFMGIVSELEVECYKII